MIKIIVIAEVPDDKGLDLCQYVCDFDTKHPGCKFSMFVVDKNKSIEQICKMMKIQSPPESKLKLKVREMTPAGGGGR